MNFLSHYYFDKASNNNLQILGSVLPDLIKNALPSVNLFPNKSTEKYNEEEQHLLSGWNRHILVDKYFHSSLYFSEQTAKLKPKLLNLTAGTEIRPSFLAHISLELLLDHILLDEKIVQVKSFYNALNNVDRATLTSFLKKTNLQQIEKFIKFFDKFLAHEYLHSYESLERISYALNQICLRLWPTGLSDTQKQQLTDALTTFKIELQPNFRQIFTSISARLDEQF